MCVRARTRTCTHARTHTHAQPHTHALAHMHTQVRTHTCAQTHAHRDARMYARMFPDTCFRTHARYARERPEAHAHAAAQRCTPWLAPLRRWECAPIATRAGCRRCHIGLQAPAGARVREHEANGHVHPRMELADGPALHGGTRTHTRARMRGALVDARWGCADEKGGARGRKPGLRVLRQ